MAYFVDSYKKQGIHTHFITRMGTELTAAPGTGFIELGYLNYFELMFELAVGKGGLGCHCAMRVRRGLQHYSWGSEFYNVTAKIPLSSQSNRRLY